MGLSSGLSGGIKDFQWARHHHWENESRIGAGDFSTFQNPDSLLPWRAGIFREFLKSNTSLWAPNAVCGTGKQQHFCMPRPQSGGWLQHDYRSEFQAGISCLPTVMMLNLYTQATGGPCMSHENVTELQTQETELPHSSLLLKNFPLFFTISLKLEHRYIPCAGAFLYPHPYSLQNIKQKLSTY